MKKVVIYREKLYQFTEPYIANQAKHLSNYEPFFVGIECPNGAPDEDYVLSRKTLGKFETILYKFSGISPRLYLAIEKIKPDLIHVHSGFDSSRFIMTKRFMKIPMVATFHGSDALTSDSWKQTSVYRCYRDYPSRRATLINHCDAFIAVSNFVKEKLIDQGYPRDRVLTHYIGINTDKFKPSIDTKKNNHIVFIGRLIKNKGCSYLIEAFKKLPEEIKATLTIVGDGPEKISLMNMAKSIESIKFTGFLSQKSIKTLLDETKVLCVPSIPVDSGASEGLGLVFLEAQAMGVPVASFNTGGIPEAVLHNSTGLLCNPNIDALATNLYTLISNDSLYNQFRSNAIKHVKLNFDINRQTKKLEEIYDKLIKDRIKDNYVS